MRGNLNDDPLAGQILIGQTDETYVPRTMSGDATIDENGVVTLGGSAGVASVNDLTGAVDITAGDNVTVTVSGQNIEIASSASAAGVASLNLLTGDLAITAGANVTVTPSGSSIEIAASGGSGGVTELNSLTGSVDITAGDNVTVTVSGQNIEIASTGGGAGVDSVNAITGAVVITAGANITVTPSGQDIEIAASGGGSGALTQIGQVIVTVDQATIEFADIPDTFTNLMLVFSGQTDGTNGNVTIAFNGGGEDSNWITMGVATTGLLSTSTGSGSAAPIGLIGDDTNHASAFSLKIMSYAATNIGKGFSSTLSAILAGDNAPSCMQASGEWTQVDQGITDIVLAISSGSNFYPGTIATLYGLQ